MASDPRFMIVLRGYDIKQVDALVQQASEALASGSFALRASVRDELRRTAFPVRLRGYDRSQVDGYLRQLEAMLADR